jgi:hypothetical protein
VRQARRPRRWKPQGEHGTPTVSVSDDDVPTEQSRNAPADREPQSISVCGCLSGGGNAERFLEYSLVQLARNTGSGITDFDSNDFCAIGYSLRIDDAHVNLTTRRRVLDRIRYEVREDLPPALA